MADELVDGTFVDRHTNIDNILVEKLLPVLEKLQTGDITVNLSGEEGEDVLAELLKVTVKQYNDDNEIVYFSYPNDGTRSETAAGKTILNYRHGTIKSPDGTIDRMSSSLTEQDKPFLRSLAINADKDIVIQLDANDMSPVRADTWHVMTFQQFEELSITTTETTNIFGYACTNPKHAYEMAGETTISIGREEREQVKSDKDSHFTTAIAQNTIEEENLNALTANEITITGLSVVADEAKSYRVWLFETDDFQETDLDNDEFIDYIDIDLSADGKQIGGAGAYYAATTGLNINYVDLDESNELHVALQNLDAGAKTAGASGEITLKFTYTPRT